MRSYYYSRNGAQPSSMSVTTRSANHEALDVRRRAELHRRFEDHRRARALTWRFGRKISRDGGIILALAKDRAEIEAIMREDPFVKHDLAEFRVIEFRASQRADDIPGRVEGRGAARDHESTIAR